MPDPDPSRAGGRPGDEEGALCCRDGCTGRMIFAPENCSCHISPPCGDCIDGLVCEVCERRCSDDPPAIHIG